MTMETFSLLDDEKQASLRDDLGLYEKYKTRMVRVDLGPRNMQDPFLRYLHKSLRAFRYWKLSRRQRNNAGDLGAHGASYSWSYQNTILIAEIIGRLLVGTVTGLFLVIPLAILTEQMRRQVQLVIVSTFIIIFSFIVSMTLRTSNTEIIMVSAAYAAVLSVFVSNALGTTNLTYSRVFP